MKNRFLFLTPLLALALTACGNNNPAPAPIVNDNTVDVYVMSGQSNMEGSTYYDNGQQWLQKAFDTLEITDGDQAFTGFDNIYTSYYGFYPYGGGTPTPHASNKTDPLKGQFENCKVGEGNRDDFMGPEIGMATKLQEYATEDNPIYFIKCAFSGSGFSSQNPNWTTRNDTDDLYYRLKTFTHNNLQTIEDMGYQPVIRGFLWHQGESDANRADQASAYSTKMRTLIDDFRTEFADYAPDQEKENIAFIDALIFDGTGMYGAVDALNDVKEGIAEDSDMNFCINTSCKREGGLGLQIGLRSGDVEGGCDTYHYKTKDMVMLGRAYADVIIDNQLMRD